MKRLYFQLAIFVCLFDFLQILTAYVTCYHKLSIKPQQLLFEIIRFKFFIVQAFESDRICKCSSLSWLTKIGVLCCCFFFVFCFILFCFVCFVLFCFFLLIFYCCNTKNKRKPTQNLCCGMFDRLSLCKVATICSFYGSRSSIYLKEFLLFSLYVTRSKGMSHTSGI